MEMYNSLKLSEEQLYELAIENTRRLLPPVIKSMNDIIHDMLIKNGAPTELTDEMITDIPENQTMWVISNDRGVNGAISVLYEDKLQELAERLDSDLYIMPSSIHEMIAIPAFTDEPDKLAEMVTEVNMDQVALGERLSNQVYHYDKNLRKLSLATDTPNKKIDGSIL
jgi:hypothetical protein